MGTESMKAQYANFLCTKYALPWIDFPMIELKVTSGGGLIQNEGHDLCQTK